ncbi:RWD-domain-containing protein [Coniochaeta hoffmannii]|uniref:RWD-domain-containing protein n=1 Tax=Coniochaeta hoffmannii TaxID=91930 RepID=A0AA38RCZ6_9PEZI|nr:RWD-domain-containing protein [Coniochaeta hoffmannii]
MGREEQLEEREVLESIFPDEIQWISDTEFRITITLDLPPDPDAPPLDEDGNDEGEAPVLILSVRYPEEYPDKAPMLELQPVPNAPPHRFFSVAADKEAILKELEATVEENLGMAMVFALVSTVKEAAEQLVIERRGAVAREREEAKLAAEREENAKFHGTPVTRETFIKWREGFMREMEEQRQREEEERVEALKKARGPKEPVKLTGKQLWQRGLVGKVVEEEDDDEEGGVEGVRDGVEGLKV